MRAVEGVQTSLLTAAAPGYVHGSLPGDGGKRRSTVVYSETANHGEGSRERRSRRSADSP